MKNLFILFTFTAFCISNSKAQDASSETETNHADYLIYSIYFGGGSSYIDEKQEQGLIDFLNKIPNIQHYSISVHSYTDDIGGVEYNKWLSAMRSESVIQKLVDQAISQDMISIQDFGELNPIYDNSTWEGKLKNRRSDVILMPLVM